LRGRIDEAIVHLKKAAELDPSVSMTYQNLAVSYWFAGRFDEAIVTATKSIDMDPASPSTGQSSIGSFFTPPGIRSFLGP